MRTTLIVFALAACSGANRGNDSPDLAVAKSDVAVVINEVFPNGADEATDPDWVELKNVGTTTVDLSGYKVRDNASAEVALPAGTTLAAGAYLIIYCDDNVMGGVAGGVHVGFKISGSSGDEFHLFTADGALIDEVTWGAGIVPASEAWGRLPDGTGTFAATTPTKGASNSAGSSDMASGPIDMTKANVSIVVNEIFPHGTDVLSDPDWVELKNTGSSTVDLSGYKARDSSNNVLTIPAGTMLAGGAYLIIYCDDAPDMGGMPGGLHGAFKLSDTADEFHLSTPADAAVDDVTWTAGTITATKGWGRLPDGTGSFALTTPTKGAANVQ